MKVEAWRARRLVTMAAEKPAVGKQLFKPLKAVDNGLLVSAAGRVAYAGPYTATQVPLGVAVQDLGNVVLAPAAVNAHTHIQLSHLAGRTLWGQGFTAWLRSLIPLLALPLDAAVMARAVAAMAASGTALVADFTSHGAAMVGEAVLGAGLDGVLLAEWFGFAESEGTWPPRCLPVLGAVPKPLRAQMAPAGHALYSTSKETLRRAHAWCCAQGRPFALHLAESPEETQALTAGDGPLVELYTDVVLPPGWKAPGRRPVPLAALWGLLGPQTLAVHGVQCDAADAAVLQEKGAHLCLCPRSNAALGVGAAPVGMFVERNVRLCLGTDGLTSNDDLDVWQEALHLLRQDALPVQAVVRLATINGAAALGRPDVGTLTPGCRCRWAALPGEMAVCWL